MDFDIISVTTAEYEIRVHSFCKLYPIQMKILLHVEKYSRRRRNNLKGILSALMYGMRLCADLWPEIYVNICCDKLPNRMKYINMKGLLDDFWGVGIEVCALLNKIAGFFCVCIRTFLSICKLRLNAQKSLKMEYKFCANETEIWREKKKYNIHYKTDDITFMALASHWLIASISIFYHLLLRFGFSIFHLLLEFVPAEYAESKFHLWFYP